MTVQKIIVFFTTKKSMKLLAISPLYLIFSTLNLDHTINFVGLKLLFQYKNVFNIANLLYLLSIVYRVL